MKRMIEDCRGSALIMVMWIVAVTGVMAVFLLYRSELEWAAVVNLERNAGVRRVAEAILQERLALLRNDDTENDTPADAWFEGDGVSQYQRDGYQVTVVIEDESSKPNLNLLDKNQLQLLDLEDEQLDPLLDWLDVDDDLREQGAELAFYQSLTPPYKPRNGFLSSMRELLAVKDGPELYEKIAPYCTVFGKYSINTLTEQNLEDLLLSYGFDKNWVEVMVSGFVGYRAANVVDNFDDLRQLAAVTKDKLEQLRSFLSLKGIININFIDETGLKMLLKKTGYSQNLTEKIIQRRQEQPFETVEEIQPFFTGKSKALKVEFYFTTVSTIIRYRIWLIKGKHSYYLETVQRRVPGDSGTKWRTYPLSWCFLRNQGVPELPSTIGAADGEEVSDG